jgi:hypothetical protein
MHRLRIATSTPVASTPLANSLPVLQVEKHFRQAEIKGDNKVEFRSVRRLWNIAFTASKKRAVPKVVPKMHGSKRGRAQSRKTQGRERQNLLALLPALRERISVISATAEILLRAVRPHSQPQPGRNQLHSLRETV